MVEESDGQLLIENDDDLEEERLMDTTIPPIFATEHILPKSSIYEVSDR